MFESKSVVPSSAQKIRRSQQFGRLFESLEIRRLFAVSYTVKNLAPNDPAPTPYGISNSGHVALGLSSSAAVYYNGVLTPLNIQGQANDVNDAGQVVGVDSSNSNSPVAFIYENGVEKKIPTLGGSISAATAINASGDVVGYSTLATGNGRHAFLYTHSTGKVTDLGLLPGGTNSSAEGINDSGQIVGFATVGPGIPHGFLYSNGQMKDLGVLPGGTNSHAYHGINNAGLIAGDSSTGGSSAVPTGIHVVTSQAGAALKDLGAPANTSNILPFDLNASGTIVGLYDDASFTARGFVESGGTFNQLDTLIDPSLKIKIFDAYAVNDSGAIVALGSVGASDAVAAYMLTPVAAAPTTGTVSGLVYKDTNGNGKQDAGETGLAGVNVFAGADGFATTAANGSYSMTLAPGSYYVYAGTPNGYSATTEPTADVTVAAGKNSPFNVGETPSNAGVGKSTINGTVYNDADGDGVFDAGETGIKGVTVTLTQSGQASFARAAAAIEPAPVTVTTDANGKYSFTGLAAGEYIVADTVPAADTQTAPAPGNYDITLGLAGSQTVSGKDFGLKAKPAPVTHSASGTVFNDANDDHLLDNGETGLAGVTVTLTPSGGGASKTFLTTSTGAYSFTGLASGTYTLKSSVPSGYTQTAPTDGTEFSLAFTDGADNATGANFGFYKAPAQVDIGGIVYNDANGNGKQDSGEAGISGVTVTIKQNDSKISKVVAAVAAPTTLTMVTDGAGHYAFTNVPRNVGYDISVTPPSGFTQVNPAGSQSVFLADAVYPNENFGLKKIVVVPPADDASIGGGVWNDANGNGKFDAGETHPSGVTITLAGNGKTVMTTTSATGAFEFDGLAAGTYSLAVTPPSGFKATTVNPLVNIQLAAHQKDTGENGFGFGVQQTPVVPPADTAVIAGQAFNDTNDNGVKDAGETGLAGVTITLSQAEVRGNIVAAVVALPTTMKTDASGNYSFKNLAAGSYHVAATTPAGYTQTSPNGAAGSYDITVTAGQTTDKLTFGEYKAPVITPTTGNISGVAFNDANNNGKRDAGEAGLSGVTIVLDPAQQKFAAVKGAAVAGELTTVTNASGAFSFAEVQQGNYTLTQKLLEGYAQTVPASGGYSITLVGGKNIEGETFAQYKAPIVPPPNDGTGTITGTLWNDTDGDGVFDNNEETGTGVRTVFLDINGNGKLDNGETSVQSDAKGKYTFLNVAVGSVKVSRLFPAGYHLSNPSAGTNGFDVITTVTAGGTATVNLGTHENGNVPPPPPPAPKFGSIAGTLWNDSDGDGMFDNNEEVGTGVRTVFLDANGNGKLDKGERSAQSTAKGKYSFADVAIGSVRVTRLFPAGFHLSNPSAGTKGLDVITQVIGGQTSTVNLGTHENSK